MPLYKGPSVIKRAPRVLSLYSEKRHPIGWRFLLAGTESLTRGTVTLSEILGTIPTKLLVAFAMTAHYPSKAAINRVKVSFSS